MRLEDARRLTGPNLFGPRPLVLAELQFDACEGPASASREVQAAVDRMRAALGLPPVTVRVLRATPSWAALGFEAPLDEMMVDAELLEWAVAEAAGPLEPKRTELAALLARDRSPRLPALEAAAAQRGVPFLWDDELVSLGHGARSVTYPRHELPEVDAVPWTSLGRVPLALVTGTNGKTTTTRLLARMVEASGRAVGTTCSDSVSIAGRTVREGDWTGPAAARLVLRSPEVDVAVLETARGGILRRGLACDAADVAVLTNVSDDHLGGYGVETLDDMAQVKAVVARAVRPGGTVVLNARDPRLVALAPTLQARVTWFADLDGSAPGAPLPADASAYLARGGLLLSRRGGVETPLLPVPALRLGLGGAARYNVENALAAAAAAEALGVPREAVARVLETFGAEDNPGRGETWTRGGASVFVDFAHNPEGVAGALAVARSRLGAGGRLTVITGSAGDRSDAELETIAGQICAANPARVVLRELEHYLRGRAPGAVPALLQKALARHGLADEQVTLAASEVEALELAARDAQPGDVAALLVHVERAAVREHLLAGGWQRG